MTTTTAVFWAAALAMVALGWGLLCLPMLRRGGSTPAGAALTEAAAGERSVANAALLAEQLRLLEAERDTGRLDDASHRAAVLEIQRRLLSESADSGLAPAAPVAPVAPARAAAAAVAAASASIAAARPPRPASAGAGGDVDRPARSALTIRRLATSWPGPTPLPLVLALALPVVAIGGYRLLGNPAGLNAAPAVTAAEPEVSKDDVAAMVDTLAARLEGRPSAGMEDLQGWVMLGRSYGALQRFDAAARAYGRALALSPDDPQLLADRADMLAMQQGQRLDGEPARLIERALAIDPKQLKALALAGSAAFERRQWAAATGYWRRARALVADGSDLAAGLDRSLAEAAASAGRGTGGAQPDGGADAVARPAAPTVAAATAGMSTPAAPGEASRAAGTAATGAATATPTSGVPAASGSAIDGSVQLAAALAGRVAPDDTVFVFARAANGPRMPLAIVRRRAADLPLDFRLDDSQAMSPALKLSGFPQVVVGVRVSRSGQAMPQPGDLIGEAPATPGGAAVRITIDRVQP